MNKKKLLVLDFDGVVVDSAKEAALSCYIMLKSANLVALLTSVEHLAQSSSNKDPSSSTTKEPFIKRLQELANLMQGSEKEISTSNFKETFLTRFVPLRPLIEDACEIVFLSLLVFEAVISKNNDNASLQEKFFGLRNYYTPEIRQSAADYLVKIRNLIIDKTESDVLKKEYFSVLPLYPQIAELFSTTLDVELAICTKRDTELTRQIVRHHGIEDRFIDIFGGEMGRKEEFFKGLEYDDITFVEDRAETLVRFAESSESFLQGIKLVFANWGYHTAQDLELLEKFDNIKRISNISELL